MSNPSRIVLVTILCAGLPAMAQDHSTFDAYRKDVETKGCDQHEEPAFTIFRCDKEMTFYYFTKSLHPAHPSVVERALKEHKDGIYFSENGRSFGPDKTQGAFEAWMKDFKALDDRLRKISPGSRPKAPASPKLSC